jgi:3',5'-cyclic AMP phosphodiesterase CpdA
MGSTLTFAVVTDIHLGPEASFEGKLRKLTQKAPELVLRFAARMRDEVKPEFIVNLGDAIEDEAFEVDRQRYDECLDLLRSAGLPLVNVAGNHDRAHLDAATLCHCWGHSLGDAGDERLYYGFERGGLHFVVLYSHERKDRDVTIDDEQLGWLEGELGRGTLPVVALVHHSLAEQDLANNRWFAKAPHICLVKNRARVRALFEASGRTLLVLNGHLHWNHFDLIGGIPYVTVQSLVENVEDDAPGVAAAAHAVVRIGPRRIRIEVEGAQPVRYQLERG